MCVCVCVCTTQCVVMGNSECAVSITRKIV